MQDFISTEKTKIQALFDAFNRDGATMIMHEGRDTPLPFGLIDSYTVTRIAPHFDAVGKLTKTDFWLVFRTVGYNDGYQYTHTIKVVDWSQDDPYLIDLVDDLGH